MTRTPHAAILGLFSAIALISPAQAQAPSSPAAKVAEQSASQLTLVMLSHIQKVYSAAASATDKATAEKAVATIKRELQQVDTITPLLAASIEPTEAEMGKVAEAIAKMDLEMRAHIEAISRNVKNKEVRTLIDPSMRDFAAKTSTASRAMEKLFPENKMGPLVKAAKARIQLQKNP